MATYEQGTRGNGRGGEHERGDMMRESDEMRWRAGGRDVRADLDRRTNRDEIDRRHDWHHERQGGGFPEERWGSPGDRFMRGESGDIYSGGRMEPGRSMSSRSFGGSAPGRYGAQGTDYHGSSGGYSGSNMGYGAYGAPGYGAAGYGSSGEGASGGSWPRDEERGMWRGSEDRGMWRGSEDRGMWRGSEDRGMWRGSEERGGQRGMWRGGGQRGMWRGSEERGERWRGGGRDESPTPPYRGGGYGGYGAGGYGGSYGGMGPGEADTYYPAGSHGGVSGAGSLMGTFGETAGWEPERQNVRPGSFAMHSMMMEGRQPGRSMRGEGSRAWEHEGALVRDVMTRDPKTVNPDTPAREAARLMREEDAGMMPVVEEGRVIGIVTDRDLAMRIIADGKDTNTQVRHVMSSDVHVCTSDDKLVDAVRTMGEESVRRLPVVDRDDRLKGVLSMSDVAREAQMDYAIQEALEQIASRRSFWSRW